MQRRRLRAVKVKWNPARKLYEPVLLEEHVLKEIVTRLWLQAKIKVFRVNCPVGGKVRPNEPGLPDLMGWIPGNLLPNVPCSRPVFIEVKRPGGARRPAQIRFISDAKSDGCVAFFAESWADVEANLKDAGVEIKYALGGQP